MEKPIEQNGLVVIAAILDIEYKRLEGLLEQLQNITMINSPLRLVKGVHFLRFLILPGREFSGKKTIPNQLLYSCSHDESLEDHLLKITYPPILQWFVDIFSCCTDFDKTIGKKEAVRNFIMDHAKKTNAFYRGHQVQSAASIIIGQKIYDCIQQYLNDNFSYDIDLLELKDKIMTHVKNSIPCEEIVAVKLPQINVQIIRIILALPFIVLLIVAGFISWLLLIGIILLLIGLVFRLRYLEIHDQDQSFPAASAFVHQVSRTHVEQLAVQEDLFPQNQLSHLVEISPGSFRAFLLNSVLFYVQTLAKYSYTMGYLGGISSIHFAGWTIIDRGNRLLFLSNFDGSWENYLSDFVDRAATGLTAVWSNTVNFPPTRFLAIDGANDEEKFKKWVRKYQIKTQVWYSAHEQQTVKNIWRNYHIAVGLFQKMDEKAVANWFKLL
ncbi:hypothetical protein [Flavitalea sp.]|nr:hypothetical protein [Flavitalea sp.]